MNEKDKGIDNINKNHDNNSPLSNVESPSSNKNGSISPDEKICIPIIKDDSTIIKSITKDGLAIYYIKCGNEYQIINMSNIYLLYDKKDKNLQIRERKCPKRKINLSASASELKYGYYSIFTNSRKFPKEYVLQIHRDLLVPHFGYPKLTREQIRRIDVYFMDYAKKKDEILEFLKQNKEEILRGPLKNIKKPKLSLLY